MMGRSRLCTRPSPLAEVATGVDGGVQKTLPSSYPARQSSCTSSDAEDPSGSSSGFKLRLKLRRYLRARDQREELPDMPPPAAEQESRDGHHHGRGCVRERGLGEDRQRCWEFRHLAKGPVGVVWASLRGLPMSVSLGWPS